MKRKKAFTLIELLVVIAIIALLLAIILPSLKIAKQQAQGIVCMANLRGFSMAWHSYAEDHGGRLVDGDVRNPGAAGTRVSLHFWVDAPQDQNGNYPGLENVQLEDELRGIEKGLLFPYVGNTDAFHCPGDKGMAQQWGGYRTYSITGLMNGEQRNAEDKGYFVRKTIEISMPDKKCVFVSNADDRGWSIGSWKMDYKLPSWVDPLTIWHNKKGTLGFADGHAEMRRWVDETTVTMAKEQRYIYAAPGTEDLTYMQRAYIPIAGKR